MKRNVTYLNVPFEEKNEAKMLGAWWDPNEKRWFVPNGKDTSPFRRWLHIREKVESLDEDLGDAVETEAEDEHEYVHSES